MSDVTRILSQLENGDVSSSDQLLPLVYEELRKLADARLRHEAPGDTLQATALVHEAYVRLVDVQRAQHWRSRGHFFGAAAQAMRRILVERARHRNSQKAGGHLQRVDLENAQTMSEIPLDDLLSLDEALHELAVEDPQKARLVELRYFAGQSEEDAAAMMGISRATASRYWSYAKAWLYCAVSGDDHPEKKRSQQEKS